MGDGGDAVVRGGGERRCKEAAMGDNHSEDDGFGWAVPLDEPTVGSGSPAPPPEPPAEPDTSFLLRGYDDTTPTIEFRPRLRLSGEAA